MWWGEANMALYYVLLRGWLHLGDSEVWLQSLSVLFGVLTIPVVFVLGRRFLNREVGLVAAAILAVHNFHIEHSEQLRSYSLLPLLVVLSTYIFLALLDTPHRKDLWVLYVLCSALAIYAQVFAVFVIGAQWMALRPGTIKRLGILKLLVAAVSITVLVIPIFLVMVLRDSGQLDWVPRLSLEGILNAIWGIVGGEILSLQNPHGASLLLLLYVMSWVFAVWGIFRAGQTVTEQQPSSSTTLSVLGCSFLYPVVAMIAISFIKPILYPRYLLMCTPAAVLVTSQGIVTLSQWRPRVGRPLAAALLASIIALSVVGANKFDASLATSGLDWRGVTKYIVEHGKARDGVVFYSFSGRWAWDYYHRRYAESTQASGTPNPIDLRSLNRSSIEDCTTRYQRVWLVLHEEIPTPQSNAKTELLTETLQQHFRLQLEQQFDGVSIYPGEDVSIRVSLYATPSETSP
jgi:4-amino-4-deoxy-L-arabinose transferase-like glycosyltransferase